MRSTVLDLLPDRDAGSVAAWLHVHPGIEVIARDRTDVFAEGAHAGAPQAQHVLDRFHLLRNLSVALRAIVAHHHGVNRAVGRARVDHEVEAAQAAKEAARPPTAIEVRKRVTHALRRARSDLTAILDRAICEATAWPLPWVAGRPDPGR
ncbi:hypothetical protein CIW48_31265 [Methylobacterium sp. P1-11]|nr:hypothetical protein CIW48_31265 [Methylobacterium sp. P1-11]